jgi:hypothetical protein
LTKEGEDAAVNGSPEAIVFGHVPTDGGILSEELDKLSGSAAKVGLSKAVVNKWLQVVKEPPTEAEAAAAAAGGKKKDAAKRRVLRAVSGIEDAVQMQLKSIKAGFPPPDADLDVLKKRGLTTMITIKSLKVSAGRQVTTSMCLAPRARGRVLTCAEVWAAGFESPPSRMSPRSMQTGVGRRRRTSRTR